MDESRDEVCSGPAAEAVLSLSEIKSWARAEGFDLCGAARSEPVTACREAFDRWLANGCDAGMEYMRRNEGVRFDPAELVSGARTVIVCAVSYRSDISLGQLGSPAPRVASYACCRDYHKVLKKMLRRLLGRITEAFPGVSGRCFTDSAPLLEKWWASQAGIGCVGRNSLIITPQWGSFVVLGEVVVDIAADRYDKPLEWEPCGSCTLCMKSCPNGAILPGRTIDARRCISRLTVESGGPAAEEEVPTCGWIFGCDICQAVCPHNRTAPLHVNGAFDPLFDPRVLDGEHWLSLDDERFRTLCGATPMARAGLERIRRTVAAAGGCGASPDMGSGGKNE